MITGAERVVDCEVEYKEVCQFAAQRISRE